MRILLPVFSTGPTLKKIVFLLLKSRQEAVGKMLYFNEIFDSRLGGGRRNEISKNGFPEQPERDQPAEHRGQRPERKVVSVISSLFFRVSRNTTQIVHFSHTLLHLYSCLMKMRFFLLICVALLPE